MHLFYSHVKFDASLDKVNKRVKRVAKGTEFRLVPGYFEESLKGSAESYGISKSRIIFIDSDTYSSASSALKFCLPTVPQGTYVILDDHYSYKGCENRGVARAFKEFVALGGFVVRRVLDYGMGGSVYIVSGDVSGIVKFPRFSGHLFAKIG